MLNINSMRVIGVFVSLLLMLPSTAIARRPGEPLRPGYNSFTKEQDIQLGKEAAAQIRQKARITESRSLQNYIRLLGNRLAAAPQARDSNFPFEFTMLDDPSVNAFALPGGPMFINTGLLRASDSEAQVAGVMGHEMAHVILRHGTNQASKQNILKLPALLAGALVGNSSLLGRLTQTGIGLGFNSVLLKFSRDDELEADALGTQIMNSAGYNPVEMARFFEKLNAQEGSRSVQFLSDHPNPGNREQAIRAEIRAFPQKDYNADTGKFASAKQEIARIHETAGTGFRSSAALPAENASGNMRSLRTGDFTLGYPENWKAYGGQNSGSVTLAPSGGLVQDSTGSVQVGVGAVAAYFFPNRGNTELRAATEDLIHHLERDDRNLRVATQPRSATVGGRPGLITQLTTDSPFGGAEQDTLVTVAQTDRILYLVFTAPTNQAARFRPSFDAMLNSIRF